MREKSKMGHLLCNKGIHQHQKFTQVCEYIYAEEVAAERTSKQSWPTHFFKL